MNVTLALALVSLALFPGCASTGLYTPDGYLTRHAVKQTSIETAEILAKCSVEYERTESAHFDCLRQLIPLAGRWGSEHAEIISQTIYASRNVVLGYEAGNISEDTTIQTLDEFANDFSNQEKIWGDHYVRVVGARNPREKALARQRMRMALSQATSELLKKAASAGSTSKTCTETVLGTLSCS
jgi:hypothetical protein